MPISLRRALLAATILAPTLALAQVAPQSPASPSGNSVRGTAQTAPPTGQSGPIQSNDTRPNQNQLNQGNSSAAPQPQGGDRTAQPAQQQPTPPTMQAQQPAQPQTAPSMQEMPQTTQTTAPAGNPNAHQDMDMAKVISTWEGLGPKPIESLTPAEARRQPTVADAVAKIIKDEKRDVDPRAGLDTTNRRFADMGDLRLRWYVPENAGSSSDLPIIVYFRGGGWVIASLDVYDATPAALARKTGAAVVSVDYPMAPENKFPAAHDEAMKAYRYVLKNAAGWGYDANRVAIVGESAGGNLAMNVAIGARDANLTRPVAVVSIYPVAATADDMPSKKGQAAAKPLNTPMLGWFFSHVLASPDQKQDPRLNLVGANLADLPPVTIIGAEIDPLRSDGDMLADKLKAANNKVTHKVYNGVTHEFFGMDAVVAKAAEAQDFAVAQLKQAFGQR